MTDMNDGFSGIANGFKNIFLAGIGALALGGEKSKELIEKGEITVEQGKKINQELTHKVSENTQAVREDLLEARMKVMTPEERSAFAAKAAEIAAAQNAQQAESAETADTSPEAADEDSCEADETAPLV